MIYNLYHVVRETAAEALAEYRAVANAVHHLGGALWTSLTDGPGPHYIVIALPVGTTLDALSGLEPVAAVAQGIFETLDPDFTSLARDEAEPVAQPEAQPEPLPEGGNV